MQANGSAFEQGHAHMADGLGIFNDQMPFLGDQIDGRHLVQIGGRGDHRLGPQAGPYPAGQTVGAPQMAGKKADGILSAFVHHHHGGIFGFVLQQAPQGPHHDTGGHDKDMARILMEMPGQDFGQSGKWDGPGSVFGSALPHKQAAFREMRLQAVPQGGPLGRQGPNGYGIETCSHVRAVIRSKNNRAIAGSGRFVLWRPVAMGKTGVVELGLVLQAL